jgi:LysR family transcriptional regulator, transcriptional activator of the cysJI operon
MVFDFRLKVFYTVAHKLSYTKAANELFITQPAVTKHINELEQQLEARLFNRNGSSISLTPAGEVLLRYAEQIFKLYTQLENELAQLKHTDSGTIRIGASTTLAQYVLPRILALFKKTHPALDVHLIHGNSEFVEQQIIAGKMDIALVEGISHHSQINYESFVKDEIVLVARTNNKFIQKNEIKPEHLLGIPLVLREQGSGTLDVIHKALSKVGISPKDLKVEMHLDSTESIKQYLLYADCAAFLSVHSITEELQANQLTIIDIKGIEIYRTFQFIQLHGQGQKLLELFKRFCLNHYNFK